MSDTELLRLLADSNGGVLVTIKRDGRPQLSNVTHHYDPATGVLRVSSPTTAPRPAICDATPGRATT